MLPLTERYARFGPALRSMYIHVPPGGVCLSAFLVVRDRRGRILFGRPRIHRAWSEQGCLPSWRVREIQKNVEWILPASHLLMGESPDDAAKRIARIWVGRPDARPRLAVIDSSSFPTGPPSRAGKKKRRDFHWTLGFVYRLRVDRLPTMPRTWEELKFFSPAEIRNLTIGRMHGDLLPLVK